MLWLAVGHVAAMRGERQRALVACWLLLSLRLRARAGHRGRRWPHLGWRRAIRQSREHRGQLKAGPHAAHRESRKSPIAGPLRSLPRGVAIALDGSECCVDLSAEDLGSIRLGYAQHVYRQQRLGEIVRADVAGCEPLTVKQIGALKVRCPCYP